ncbi:Ig-like domain-containing protein, partial [Roseibacterium beibuensis]|nr:Ig-like domain-containing protein [Roseibacterium beibuensis]
MPEAFEAGDVFSLTFTFSENVIGFEAGDIGVTGGTLS